MRNVLSVDKEKNAASVLGGLLHCGSIHIPSRVERLWTFRTPLLNGLVAFGKVLLTMLGTKQNKRDSLLGVREHWANTSDQQQQQQQHYPLTS